MPELTPMSLTSINGHRAPQFGEKRIDNTNNARTSNARTNAEERSDKLKQSNEYQNFAGQEFEESFVWPEGARPDIDYDKFDFQLPVIDLAPAFKLERLQRELEVETDSRRRRPGIEEEIKSCEVATAGVVTAIRAACEEYGFFQIVNHGFPMEVADQLLECCKHIFNRPLEEKMRASEETPFAANGLGSSHCTGYTPMKRSTAFTRNNKSHIWNEGFNIFWPEIQLPGRLEQVTNVFFPGEPGKPITCSEQGHLLRSCAEEYAKQSGNLTLSLLNLMALSLGLPRGSVEDLMGPSEDSRVFGRARVNHYPVCANPELTWGLQGHTDPSIITLLHQDAVGGLQMQFNDGTWHGVQPTEGALVVNVGDYLQAWTNRRFLSAEHRAVANQKSPRYSIAYFAWPLQREVIVSPRPELVDATHPARYRPFTQNEYFGALLAFGASCDRDGFMDRVFGVHNNVMLKV